MKKHVLIVRSVTFFVLLMGFIAFKNINDHKATVLNGAWQLSESGTQQVVIFSNGYFMYADYDKGNKKLLSTRGGTYQVQNDRITVKQEFNSQDKEQVGRSDTYPFSIKGDQLSTEIEGDDLSWKRLDNGTGLLAGVWRSGGRLQEGKVTFNPLGARKTFKMLSGTRFQWTAMNTGTKEFLGSGGGTYTFVNGKYTENIEFFSRDSSRVGMSLVFDGKIDNNAWYHSGLNSRGTQMNEIWGKVE